MIKAAEAAFFVAIMCKHIQQPRNAVQILNFSLRLFPTKKKAAMEVEKPRAIAVLQAKTPCPLFLLTKEAQKKKLSKRKR